MKLETHYRKIHTIEKYTPQASLREDPWRVLGVSPSANDQQIKKAYRKLALKHHPDVDPSDAAHERFLMIQEAYELVSGKRRGKESDHQHSSWEFHDWYVCVWCCGGVRCDGLY